MLINDPELSSTNCFPLSNAGCGHCQRFAPVFKEFGKLIANWNPVVQVLALNCVDEQNEEVCRNYSVTSYPTVRLFWTNVNDQEDHGEHIDDLQHSAEFLRDRTIEFTLRNLRNRTKSAPTGWPNLNKIPVADQPELKRLASGRLQVSTGSVPVVAIAEKNDSFVGQQVSTRVFSWVSSWVPVSNFVTLQAEPHTDFTARSYSIWLSIEPLE